MQSESNDGITEPTFSEVKFEYTPQFPEILAHLDASILVTTYQAGKLLVLGAHEGKLQISFLSYDQPMGLAVGPNRIAVGTRKQIHFLVPAHETQQGQDFYDGCFVPRSSFYTGSIHGHDLGWGDDGLWIVNTLFSSLATLHDDYSFVPRWRPPYISQLIDQDRCHLNGMAIGDGLPKFVSAMSETDTAAGWRPNKATSGVVVLDPMHFGGGNSSLEAIAMGTPVVTIAGEFLRSRITYAIYCELNLLELSPQSLDEYRKLAVRIACEYSFRDDMRHRVLQAAEKLFCRVDVATQLEICLLELAMTRNVVV